MTDPIPVLDAERTDLLAALAGARAALTATVDGLTDEQAGERPTASALCLGGLVKHVTRVEERWLRFVVEGPEGMHARLPEGVSWGDIMSGTAEPPQWMVEHQESFAMQPGETLAEVLRQYEEVAARTAETVAALPDLSVAHPLPEAPWQPPGQSWSARRVLAHVIAETSQHAGHADIIRETLDGRTAT
ncbi:DinB family protein [Streptomyces lichenis]|uniref:DinB family protein n=1 Tax=Streptomyces lichenis TaxID=2306967 RepID=A0ABT0I4C4_9ACTN|nr:DinB family protein [Streptomyces lichenis]MCK8676174.1 DinB family protein [Streptomyces lichenis]